MTRGMRSYNAKQRRRIRRQNRQERDVVRYKRRQNRLVDDAQQKEYERDYDYDE